MRPGGADEPRPAPQTLTVVTQHRAYAGFQGRPGDPFDRLPVVRPQSFRLSRTPPSTLVKALERTDGAFGNARWAGREVLVALYAPEGSSLRMPLLCVDMDGDGAFETPGEQRRVTGHTSDRGQRWDAEITVDGVPAVLEVERTPLLRRLARVERGVRRTQVLDAPPPGGVLVPGGGKADLIARLKVGGRDVLVGAVLPEEGPARVGFDLDGDRRLDLASEWREAEEVEALAGERAWRFAGEILGEGVALRVEERPAQVTGTLSPPGALRGTLNAGGRTLALLLLDRDLDGAFTSREDLWWFGPLERLGRVHELTPETMVEGDEPTFLGGTGLGGAGFGGAGFGGTGWRISIVEADGTAHLVADPDASAADYLARRFQRTQQAWAARLEVEARAFREANGIDPARARSTSPPAWRHATALRDSLEVARRAGKPLFAFFEADWCLWCKRLDLHTFGDAEVGALLERFVCVRLNYEFLTGDEYERYGGRGLPLHAPDGRPGAAARAPGPRPLRAVPGRHAGQLRGAAGLRRPSPGRAHDLRGAAATVTGHSREGGMTIVLVLTLVGCGLLAGTLGSLVGVGGGVIIVPALMTFAGLDARAATGTSIAVIVPTMLVALWRRGAQGHVSWQLAALCALGAVGGAFIGAALAGKLPPVVIRRCFAGFLALMSVWLFLSE